MDEFNADLGGHDCDTANLVLHHAIRSFSGPPGIIVGITKNYVVTELTRPRLEALDYFGKERILDIGDDDSEGAAIARGEVAGMNVRDIAHAPDCLQHDTTSVPAHLAGLVQHVRDGRGGNPRG